MRCWIAALVALSIGLLGDAAVAVRLVPIPMPTPQAYGAVVNGVHGDEKYLYLRTDAFDLIAVDKDHFLKGTPTLRYMEASQWPTVFRTPSTTTKLELLPASQVDSQAPAQWKAGVHTVSAKAAYCGEGADQHHALRIDGLTVDTGMAPCMSLSSPVLLDGKLWFGTTFPGEYADRPGIGVLVFDLESKRRVFQIQKALSQQESGLLWADAWAGGVWVVNRSAIHFFDRDFRLVSRWYYSEQLDPSGENWSVLQLSPQFQRHDAFAVMARIIQTPPARETGNEQELQRALSGPRWASKQGIAAYQKRVEQLPKDVRSDFWIYYDPFERQHLPMWRKGYMTHAEGGRRFRQARDLIVCLHREGDGARGRVAEELVQKISAAGDDGNRADAPLRHSRCDLP